MSDSISCKTCRYWEDVSDSNWSVCILTKKKAHETLTEAVVYVLGHEDDSEEVWLEAKLEDKIEAILRTREDFGCVQYESKELPEL